MTDTAPIPTVTATIEKDTDVASEGKAEIADLPKDDSGEKKETEGLSEDPKTCGKSTDSIDNDVLMTQTQGTMDAASSNAVDKEGVAEEEKKKSEKKEEEPAVPDPVNAEAADENGAATAAEKDVESSNGATVEVSKSGKKKASATPKIIVSKRNKRSFDLSLIFELFLQPMLEADGWIILQKKRTAGTQMDRYFIPSGVKKAAPFKPRVDYFDSFSQLWNSLRSREDYVAGKRVLNIYFMCKSLLIEGFLEDESDAEVRALGMFKKAQERIDNGIVAELDQLMPKPREKKSPTSPSGQSEKSKASSANKKRRISGDLSPVNVVKGARRRRMAA